ncbi:MAG: hypothetical protein ACM3XM_06860 [Mycobacterium leprae]
MRNRDLTTTLLVLALVTGCGTAKPPAAQPSVDQAAVQQPQPSSPTPETTPAPQSGPVDAAPAAPVAVDSSATHPPDPPAPSTVPVAQHTTLTPDPVWQVAAGDSLCGTMDTRTLRAVVRSDGSASTTQGGKLTLHLHNNTNMCGDKGVTLKLTNAALMLEVVPYGATAPDGTGGEVLGHVALPTPPAELAPGAVASLGVAFSGGLRPGWVAARIAGHLTIDGFNGGPLTLTLPDGSDPFRAAIQRFQVTGVALGSGEAAAKSTGPATIGGAPVPAAQVKWSATDVFVTIPGPTRCAPGVDYIYSVGMESIVARGPGFDTVLPVVGGGSSPVESYSSFQAAPGGTTTLHYETEITVVGCKSDGEHTGDVRGTGTAVYDFPVK